MRLEELERELRAERPDVNPDFARKLDDWAAAGFPRDGELASPGPALPAGLRRAWDRLRAAPPRRLIAPVGAAATLLIAVVVALNVSVSGDFGGSTDDSGVAGQAVEPTQPEAGAQSLEDGGAAKAVPPTLDRGERASGGEVDALGTADVETFAAPSQDKLAHGEIARNVDLALATAPEDFRDAADGVLDVVDDHGGFVLRSRVSGGDPGVEGAAPGSATFEIRVRAGQLQAAIAGLSDLGHVVSRTDGTEDITSRFDAAKRRIAAYTESRDRLLRRLEDAATETERAAIQAQLRIVEAQLDDAEADLGAAEQRVRLVPVTVTVTSDPSVTGDGDGDWGISDALDDAGRVLTVAGGVLLISAAVLLPLTLLFGLAWFLIDRARRHQRERTLDAG